MLELHDAVPAASLPEHVDVAIVGAGFSGLYMAYRVRQLGLSFAVLEAGSDIGGTWFWNRYPGAHCDIESVDYAFSFAPEIVQSWNWSKRYAPQDEILRYLHHVADRLDLRRHVALDTRVSAATYDDATTRWTLATQAGVTLDARYVVMATGCLSAARIPAIAGLESFAGATYHTGQWPHAGVDFSGQRVAVIGTGSSGVQSIPLIAESAAHLTVFQRTPNFVSPAWNGPLDPAAASALKTEYPARRDANRASFFGVDFPANPKTGVESTPHERAEILETYWQVGGLAMLGVFSDVVTNAESNAIVADFIRAKIRATVTDSAVAEKLCPTDHAFGTKRPCVGTDYYETYNRPNVTLVDVRTTPIEAITPAAIRTSTGDIAVDSIVFATGFDAMTGALLAIDIRGAGGQSLREQWAAGPRTYLGVASAGFPNLFLVTGPGSPSVLSNMLTSIEQHVDWIADAIDYAQERGLTRIEASLDAQNSWVDHVNTVAHFTLYPQANSWYMGANIPGKPRVFMPYIGGVGNYRQHCATIAANAYEGFVLGTEARV